MSSRAQDARKSTRDAIFFCGAHVDRVGRLKSPAALGASNPITFKSEIGGASFNAAATAAQLGVNTVLCSPVGNDSDAKQVMMALSKFGIHDLLFARQDQQTASYTSIIDPSGDLVMGLADMEIYDSCEAKPYLKEIGAAPVDYALLNANMPAGVLGDICNPLVAPQLAFAKKVAITISVSKAPRLSGVLEKLDILFTNRREACVLSGLDADTTASQDLASALRDKGCDSGTISSGAKDLFWWDRDNCGTITPNEAETVTDVTGAGDTLAGTCMAALMHGHCFEESVRLGIDAAGMVIGTSKPVYEGLSWDILRSHRARTAGGEIVRQEESSHL